MVNKLGFAKRFLLLVTPLVTSSAIAQFAVGIAASPSLAATLASSEASFNIDNFSHNPLDVFTLADTDTSTITTSAQVTAEADAFATFINNPSESPYASNSSFSRANGEGSNYYLGQAQSLAGVIGYNFLVGDGETFSFDFDGFLRLETSIDNLKSESANAAGELSFNLYDSTDSNNMMFLDSFTISSNLTTPGDGDFLDSQVSNNITLTSDSEPTSFGGTQESASALVEGQFSRYFANSTDLTLIEVKTNEASVTVPEPSSTLGLLLFCLIGVGYKVRRKHLEQRQNLLNNRS